MNGILKTIKTFDDDGNEVEIEVTEYPEIPVIVVDGGENENGSDNNSGLSAV